MTQSPFPSARQHPARPGLSQFVRRRRTVAGAVAVLVLAAVVLVVWHPWNRVSGLVRDADQATPVVPVPLAGLRTKPSVAWQLRTGSDPLPYPSADPAHSVLFVNGSMDGSRRAPWAFAAVSAKDGTLRWSRATPFQFQGYVSGGVLGVSGSSLQVLDPGSGKIRWTRAADPVTDATGLGDVVLLRRADAGQGITVLSATDGKRLWQRGSGHWLASTPSSQTLYALDGRNLQVVDASTGKVLESSDVAASGSIDPAGSQIWAINGRQPVALVRDSRVGRTVAYTRGSLEPVWRATLTGEPVALPADPGLLITKSAGDTTETYARSDPATGRQLWTLNVEGPFPNGTTASAKAGKLQIYGQRADGSALVEDVDLATGKLLWRKQLARTVNLSVSAADDVVYVRHDDGVDVSRSQLVAFDASTGTKLWEVAPSTLGLMTPAPVDHGLLVESGTGLRRLG